MHRPVPDQGLGFGEEPHHRLRLGEIRGDMVGPIGIAAALGRHLVARAGDDLPALVAAALHRGMADAPAGAGQHHPRAVSIAGLASTHGAFLTRRHWTPYRNPAPRAPRHASVAQGALHAEARLQFGSVMSWE